MDIKSRKSLIAIPLLILLALGACQNPLVGSAISTWTPLPTSTPTCAPDIKLSTPEGWRSVSRLIIILFDPYSIGDQRLEFSDGTSTTDVNEFVSRIAPHLLGPGDQASVFRVGYEEYEHARFSRLYSYSPRGQLYNTPSPHDTLIPVPTLGTQEIGLVGIATANEYKNQVTANAATSTANAIKYHCQVMLWNGDAELTATALKQVQIEEHATLGSQMVTEVAQFRKEIKGKHKSNTGFELYDGLKSAAIDLSTDCNKYDQCILIVIDDLMPLVPPRPEWLKIDLHGAMPYVIMPNCRDLHQPSCTTLQNYWNFEFERFYAGKAEYFNGQRVETKLLNIFGR